jgi:hypothetical protein
MSSSFLRSKLERASPTITQPYARNFATLCRKRSADFFSYEKGFKIIRFLVTKAGGGRFQGSSDVEHIALA